MKKTGYGALLLVLLLTSGVASAATPPQKSFSVGIVPQQNPTETAKIWTPLLNHLSEKTGYHFKLQTAKDIATFNKRLKVGTYDIAYMNPLLYAINKSHNYKTFAKEKDTRLKGLIVVAKTSNYDTIESLRNTTMAFPDPDSFGATLLPLAYLKKAGITVTPKNVMSHDSVYRAVAKGLFPAGGGALKTLGNVDPAVRDQLRILWESPPYTPHPFAAQQRVPQEVVKKLFAAMSALHLDPKGKALLAGIKFKGIESAEDHEYDEIRALKDWSGTMQ